MLFVYFQSWCSTHTSIWSTGREQKVFLHTVGKGDNNIVTLSDSAYCQILSQYLTIGTDYSCSSNLLMFWFHWMFTRKCYCLIDTFSLEICRWKWIVNECLQGDLVRGRTVLLVEHYLWTDSRTVIAHSIHTRLPSWLLRFLLLILRSQLTRIHH